MKSGFESDKKEGLLKKFSENRPLWHWLIIIGLTALSMRLVIGKVIVPIEPLGPHTSPVEHFKCASHLLNDGVYTDLDNLQPRSLRMPLYALCIAGVRLVSGQAEWESWVVAINYLIGSITCVLLALLGIQLLGEIAGLI